MAAAAAAAATSLNPHLPLHLFFCHRRRRETRGKRGIKTVKAPFSVYAGEGEKNHHKEEEEEEREEEQEEEEQEEEEEEHKAERDGKLLRNVEYSGGSLLQRMELPLLSHSRMQKRNSPLSSSLASLLFISFFFSTQ